MSVIKIFFGYILLGIGLGSGLAIILASYGVYIGSILAGWLFFIIASPVGLFLFHDYYEEEFGKEKANKIISAIGSVSFLTLGTIAGISIFLEIFEKNFGVKRYEFSLWVMFISCILAGTIFVSRKKIKKLIDEYDEF